MQDNNPKIVRFGVFEVDLSSGELRKQGTLLRLQDQPFQILSALLDQPGQVVAREDLIRRLWRDGTAVEFEHGLNAAVTRLRQVLSDSAESPRYIETVARRGYRFIGQMEKPSLSPAVAEAAEAIVPSAALLPAAPSRKWMAVAAGIATSAVAAWLMLTRAHAPAPVNYKLTQVTRDSGLTQQPSISADGNFVVYSSDRATGKDMDLWIQHVSGGQPVRLTSTPDNEMHPSLSADGRKVAFQLAAEGIYVVPALGGTPKLLAAKGQSPQISPDGTWVAYSTGRYMQASEVQLVSSEGGLSQSVSSSLKWAMAPLWTPDGRNLLIWAGSAECADVRPGPPCDYWMVPPSGGLPTAMRTEEQLIKVGARSLHNVPPILPVASDGPAGLVVAAASNGSDDLWFVPPFVGQRPSPATRITLGAGAINPSVAAATGRIAFARRSVTEGLWVLPIDGATGRVTGELRRAGRENATFAYPSASADGKKVAYVSNRAGDPDVWIRDLDTGTDRQLTSSKVDEFRAMISPDGGRVAFGIAGSFYLVPANGGEVKLVCRDCGTRLAGWSPDGTQLLYYWGSQTRHAVVDLATGKKRDVVWHPTAAIHNGRISPDGRWITFNLVEAGNRVIYVASMAEGEGGRPEKWIRISRAENAVSSFWSRDGNLLYIHQDEALWACKLSPDTKNPVGDAFLVQRLDARFAATFSADGVTKDALYFVMKETTSNVWVADPAGR